MSENKFFSAKQVSVSAILAGPLPAGVMLAKNYQRIGETDKSRIVLAITVVFTISLFYFLIMIAPAWLENIPNSIFTIAYGLFVYFYFDRVMQEELQQHEGEEELKYESNWQVVRISAIWLMVTLVIMTAIGVLKPAYPGEMHEYKGNQLFHDQSLKAHELDAISEALQTFGHFEEGFPTAAQIRKDEDHFQLIFQFPEEKWDLDETLDQMKQLKKSISNSIGRETFIVVEQLGLDGKIRKRVY
ncbi:MAG: hypothetical protein ACI8QD_002976 [Cyclobacteriaceae bacterium]|jgi:hypothetical protein